MICWRQRNEEIRHAKRCEQIPTKMNIKPTIPSDRNINIGIIQTKDQTSIAIKT